MMYYKENAPIAPTLEAKKFTKTYNPPKAIDKPHFGGQYASVSSINRIWPE
jgi:hypothetical protein